MNIIVTGGAGFIGSHLCEKLLKLGHRILCIDNFNDFYDPRIKRNNIKGIIENPDFKLFEVDILSQAEINNIFSSYPIDLVIHLAARAGVRPSITQPLLYEKVNVIGTLNILEACKKNKINKLIFASSSSIYGANKKIPFSEEDSVDFPVSPYAFTKKSGELICYTYHHLYNIDTICVRFFTVYGPRQRPEMAIHKFTRKIFNKEPIDIYGDGSSSRDYTYIDDIINGVINMIGKVKGYEIVNLGNSYPVKLIDLVHLIEDTTGIKATINFTPSMPGDVFITCADIRKARKYYNYNPKVTIKEGLIKFIDWYKEQGEGKRGSIE